MTTEFAIETPCLDFTCSPTCWKSPLGSSSLEFRDKMGAVVFSREETMLKAVVSQGEIRPLEPLPADWQEGQQLRVEKADGAEFSLEEIDRDFAVLAALCESSEPAAEEQLERALREARLHSKKQVLRHMGLA
jgi:hypothetical protein